jgi:hypothetical protein
MDVDNTVGSCETKYWQKKWISIKSSLQLLPEQKTMIVGSLLGDGTMRLGEGCKNANFKVEHGLQQAAYVRWKYDILKPLVFTEPKISFRYQENGERYAKSWWFRTIRHAQLTEIYNEFYTRESFRGGRKIVPKSIKGTLKPIGLAIWIMDDGCYTKGRIDISTYAFSLIDIQFLRKCLTALFQVNASIRRDRDKGYRMYFDRQESKRIIEIIHPYIIPSMMYKIGFATP